MQHPKYLYLPLEIVIREHDGKTTLAHEAAKRGWTCVIGPKLHLYSLMDDLPEGVFLIKSVTPAELSQIQDLKKAGHKICSIDEEGVVTFKEFLGNHVRFSKETVQAVDHIFFWGQEQSNSFIEAFPEYAEKGIITGSPRLEFWRKHALKIYKSQVEELKDRYGDYVLFPSSFGIANNVFGMHQGMKLTRNHSTDHSEKFMDFLIGQSDQNYIVFQEYLDFFPEIAERFPDTNFIIRPHPSESHDAWVKLCKKWPNLHFAYEGSVTPWILAAKEIFHFKSTTSLEAYLMGRPVVTYVPPLPPYMNKFKLVIPLAVSQIVESREDFLSYMKRALKQEKQMAPGAVEGVLKDWIFTEEQTRSAERMVDIFEKIAPKVMKFLTKPQPHTKTTLKSQLENLAEQILALEAVEKFTPEKFKRRIKAKSYGKRKYQGLDIQQTRKIVEALSQSDQQDSQNITVQNYTETLFLIKSDAA